MEEPKLVELTKEEQFNELELEVESYAAKCPDHHRPIASIFRKLMPLLGMAASGSDAGFPARDAAASAAAKEAADRKEEAAAVARQAEKDRHMQHRK